MNLTIKSLREKAAKWPFIYLTIITSLAAFGCYTSVYAFRKAFTAAVYEDLTFFGVDYKVWLVIAQVFGYMLSKFYGIRFIAEKGYSGRALKIIIFVGISWLSLLGFALLPPVLGIFCLFLNGLPLGMMWGLVFSYLEGRRTTEILAAIMSVSLVFASGFVKTIGRILIDSFGVTAHWMPFVTGLLFVIPLLLCTLLLEIVPPPDAKDKALRTERKPMSAAERRNFLMTFFPGLLCTVLAYVLLTILRDIRDNFEVEIWADIGLRQNNIYTKIDSFIALVVLVVLGLLILVKNNLRAFTLIHMMVIAGCILAGTATWLFSHQLISNISWMTAAGLGIYLAYIPYNAVFFERLLATFKHAGNIGFIMYVADAAGYLGSVAVLVVRELGFVHLNWGHFFQNAVWVTSLITGLFATCSLLYFYQKKKGMTGFSFKKNQHITKIINPE